MMQAPADTKTEPAIGTTLTPLQQEMKDIDNFFRVHELVGNKPLCVDEIRNAGRFFAEILVKVAPRCADRTAALRKIREAVWTAIFAVAADTDIDSYMKSRGYDPSTELAIVPETLKRDSYNLLHDWIEENMKSEIGKSTSKSGETAVELAIRVMSGSGNVTIEGDLTVAGKDDKGVDSAKE